MASALFYRLRPRTSLTRALRARFASPSALRVTLAVRAFGLDLVVHAGPLCVETREALLARASGVFEFLLPDLPLPDVRPTFARGAGREPCARAIAALVRMSSSHVPAFRALPLEHVDVRGLLAACASDNLPRVTP